MNPEELFGKDFDSFSEVDPFNPNLVEGYISKKPNEYYGALIITRVNHQDVTPQLIMGSPKIPYPFSLAADGTKNYHFPSAKSIEAFEKYDGTNVVGYTYQDSRGYIFDSYKLRLRPFIVESRFGNFLSMWKELSDGYFDAFRTLMTKNHCNLSFEIYGARNRHLIHYQVPLAFALLFGVTNTGRILSPTDLGALSWREAEKAYIESWGLPAARLMETIDRDYIWRYEGLQDELEAGLKEYEEEYYTGVEGAVWYLHTHDGRTLQFKCKPPTVEDIHRAAAGGIPRHSIIATCWNSYENTDDPDVEFIKQLLKEEFPEGVIEASEKRIAGYLDFVKAEMSFRMDVVDRYRALGWNILIEKGNVMRVMSKHYPKNQMRKVYSIITAFA